MFHSNLPKYVVSYRKDEEDYYILHLVEEEGTGIYLYREFCKVEARGRHYLARAIKIANILNKGDTDEYLD